MSSVLRKKFYKKSKFPLKPFLSLCLSVIIYAALLRIFERFKFSPEISFLTVLLYNLSVIIKSKDKTRCKSVRLIQKEENMSFIVLFIGLIIYGIWKNCEPQIPASYHNNWKLEQEDSWKVSTGEIIVTLNVYPRLHKQPGVVLYPSVFLIPKNNLKKPASILGVLQTTIFIICTSLSAKEHQPYSQCNEQQ